MRRRLDRRWLANRAPDRASVIAGPSLLSQNAYRMSVVTGAFFLRHPGVELGAAGRDRRASFHSPTWP